MREGLKPLLFVLQTPLQDVTASEGGCNTMFGLGLPRLHLSICLTSADSPKSPLLSGHHGKMRSHGA